MDVKEDLNNKFTRTRTPKVNPSSLDGSSDESIEDNSLTVLAKKKRTIKKQLEAKVNKDRVAEMIEAYEIARRLEEEVSGRLNEVDGGDQIDEESLINESVTPHDNEVDGTWQNRINANNSKDSEIMDGPMEPLASPNLEITNKETFVIVGMRAWQNFSKL
ncbi:uncharacterized protein LOC103571506 isoform X2 [Microplitis demolitor]|uniref:uncharacterized protein LOC103571506 isoform X2 n=1 Tax=Microplitis demolitor TaxID=69319 RepID=UPI00235B6496|nr:uncharacterized protein LOC103571506 isoform X2 [Microplitis demolitor]